MLCLCIGKLNIIEISSLPSPIYKYDASPVKLTGGIFGCKNCKLILKLIWNAKMQKNKNYFGNYQSWKIYIILIQDLP